METEQQQETYDYITYARYKVIRDDRYKIKDFQFIFANERLKNVIGYDPTGMYRSSIMPKSNERMCKYAQNVLDIGVGKHFSYSGDILGDIEGMMEIDVTNKDCVNLYTVDTELLKTHTNNQIIKSQVSTILSLYNISLLHWNAKEHYVYADNILTTDFSEGNPDLYIGNSIRPSYDLYKITDRWQQKNIEEQIHKLLNNEVPFLNFSLTVTNSVGEDVDIQVIIIPEDIKDLYLIGVQY